MLLVFPKLNFHRVVRPNMESYLQRYSSSDDIRSSASKSNGIPAVEAEKREDLLGILLPRPRDSYPLEFLHHSSLLLAVQIQEHHRRSKSGENPVTGARLLRALLSVRWGKGRLLLKIP